MTTFAPPSLAASAAHDAALPVPTTTTSMLSKTVIYTLRVILQPLSSALDAGANVLYRGSRVLLTRRIDLDLVALRLERRCAGQAFRCPFQMGQDLVESLFLA